MNFFNGNYEVLETSSVFSNGDHKFMWLICQSQSVKSMFYLVEINVLNREDSVAAIPFEIEMEGDSYLFDKIYEYSDKNIKPNLFIR